MRATKPKARRKPIRRQPKQRRARQTIDAVLDALAKILKREGFAGVTTNRIAAVAGVSIGSVYQYFPDKRAIFAALFNRHIEETGRVVERALVEHAASPLDDVVRALIDAMIEAHTTDPALHELLSTEVPHGADVGRDFEERLSGALRLTLASRMHEIGPRRDLDRMVFVLTNMIESLAHGAVLRRPSRMSLGAARDEAVAAVLGYLHAH